MLNSLGQGNWIQMPDLKTGVANGFCWVRIWRTGGTPSPVISKIIVTRGGLVVRLCATGTLQYTYPLINPYSPTLNLCKANYHLYKNLFRLTLSRALPRLSLLGHI